MPCSSIPLGVSSMFSVAETSMTPASCKARWIVTSSARLRASRSTLWTMQYATRLRLTYWIIRISSGRSALRADSPASMNSFTMTAPSCSALRRLASRWAGMEKPSSVPPFSACSLVETRR
ncbi:hypothetical protein RIU96_06230 [Corynebacterium sp. Z-1]|nr:hypothetical protein [Corynebacterium sp. Z-1]WNI11845.1 hypothetical protein RIU96_06230 [Corynebacterium sp. Z-1]